MVPPLVVILSLSGLLRANNDTEVGREVAIPRHLQDGEEFSITLKKLLKFGQKLFTAGRPLSKGTGAPLSDLSDPLVFPRNFNRLSGASSGGDKRS